MSDEVTHKTLFDEWLKAKAEADRVYYAKLAELQATCPHESVSGWLDADNRGYHSVRICNRCHKEIEERRTVSKTPFYWMY